METSRAERLRGKLGALALLIGPGLIFVADVIEPTVDFDDRAAVLDVVAANTGRWNLAQLVFFVGFLLMVPAAIVAARTFRRSRPGLSLTATVLAPLVPLMILGFVLFGFADEAFVAEGADREQMVALSERIDDVTLVFVPFALLIIGMLGMLVLAIGLWRSKAAPVWVPIAIVVGFLVAFFGPQDVAAVSAIANLILWAGFGAIGLKILSEGGAAEAPAPGATTPA